MEEVHVAFIHRDVRLKFQKPGSSRLETAFFWAVRGGNVNLVRETLVALKRGSFQQELKWLLGTTHKPRGRCMRSAQRFADVIKNVLMLILLVVLLLAALTPAFPVVHYMVAFVLGIHKVPNQSSTSLCSDLPLFLACMSQNQAMLELFRQHGVKLDQTDDNGSNIFHVLVAYSVKDHKKSRRAFTELLEVYSGGVNDVLQQAVLKQTDRNGLTALESCVKYGAAEFLDTMLNTEGLVRKTLVCITPYTFSIEKDIDTVTNKELDSEEWGSFRYNHDERLPKHQMYPVSLRAFHKCNQEESNNTPVEDNERTSNTHINRLRPIQNGMDDTKGPSYSRVLYDVTDYEYGGIFNKQSLLLTLLVTRPLKGMTTDQLEILLNNKMLSEWRELKARCIHRVFIAGQLCRLLYTCAGILFCFVITMDLVPGEVSFPLSQQFLIDMEDTMHSRMHDNPNATSYVEVCGTPGTGELDGCALQALQLMQEQCISVNLSGIMSELQENTLSHIWSMEGYSLIVLRGLTVLAMWQLLTRILTSLMFITQNIHICSYPLWKGLRRTLAIPPPGSALDQCLTDLTAWILIFFACYVYLLNTTDDFDVTIKSYISTTASLLTCYMFFVCITLLVSLRLVPVIGFYITTTVHLAKCLGQFLVVYVIVFLATSCLFQYIMRDLDCKLIQVQGFGTLYQSMYQTYKLLHGVGEFYYDIRMESKILYIIYSLYCVLLLLNFIIAIMSSTADAISSGVWRNMVRSNDYINEYLLYEVLVNMVTSLFGLNRWLLRRAGYVLMRNKVYVQVEMN